MDINSIPTQRNHSFKSGNIIWTHDPAQDKTERDSRGQYRVIKRYVGRNRGKDYAYIKWLAKQTVENKNGGMIFSVNTDQA